MASEHTNGQSLERPSPVDMAHVMLEHTEYLLGLLDPSGTVLEVNQRGRELLDPAQGRLTGRPIWELPLWLPEERSRLQRELKQASRNHPVHCETEVNGADNRRVTLDVSVRPICNDEGELTCLILEGHESSKRKQTEVALEHERVFLQAVLDNIADGIAACDAEGVLNVFNPASRTFHGLREFPIPAAGWAEHYDLYRPDGLTPLAAEEVPLYRALQGEVVQNVEMVIAPKGSKKRRLLASGRKLVSLDGETLGAVVAMRDVTATHESRLALQAREAHYRTVIGRLSEGIVQQDRNGHIVMANAAAERTLGLTQAQLLERDNLDPRWRTVHEDGTPFPGETHPSLRALRTGEPQEGFIMGVHKPDGSLTWILVNCQPLWELGEAEPYGVVSSFTDVTALKQTEAQLRYASLHDALTGLPGRTLFHERLEQALGYAAREPDYRFAVLYIDLDGFKTVNDTLGHSIGDNLLVTVSRQLAYCVRGSDTVARLGGDEFAVLLERLPHPSDAVQLAERVLHDLAISLKVAGREVSVSASIGIVLSGEERHARDLLNAADQAMYRAKAAGKARYQIFGALES